MSPVRRPRAASFALTTAVVAAAALSGCSAGGDSSPPRHPAAPTRAVDSGTPLQDVDTSGLVVRRAPFCDLVDASAVTRALGAQAQHATTYRSGQRTKVSAEVADVVHEFGCVWKAGRSTARAWVFLPPVTRQQAQALAGEADRRSGCSGLQGAPRFGDPDAALSCHAGSATQVSYAGLFGDAWLTCTLTSPGDQQQGLVDRAGRWCAAVATAAATPAG